VKQYVVVAAAAAAAATVVVAVVVGVVVMVAAAAAVVVKATAIFCDASRVLKFSAFVRNELPRNRAVFIFLQ